MENRSRNNDLIAQSYVEYYQDVLNYISARVNDIFDAENIAQDVWLRLLEYDKQLAAESLRPFIYTVARNLVNDYLRHIYITRAVEGADISLAESIADYNTESLVVARDIALFEAKCVKALPERRRIIYVLARFKDRSVDEIALGMDLSMRTVENQLCRARRTVRGFISAIA